MRLISQCVWEDTELDRQRQAPQWAERERQRENVRRMVESDLRRMHVHPDIIARVLRLNPNPMHGDRLRGIHYKDGAHGYRFARFMSKGRFIRRYGREAFERIPPRELHKDGKRAYIAAQTARDLGLWA